MREFLAIVEAGFTLLMGALLTLVCLSALTRSVRLSNVGVRVVGKVTGEGTDDDNDRWVTVAYSHAGQEYVCQLFFRSEKIGEPVVLLIDPECPKTVGPVGAGTGCLLPAAGLFCGVIIAIGAVVFLNRTLTPSKPVKVTVPVWHVRDADGKMSIRLTPPDPARPKAKPAPAARPGEDRPDFVGPPAPRKS